MEPSIRRSIAEGFRATHRGWPMVLILAVCYSPIVVPNVVRGFSAKPVSQTPQEPIQPADTSLESSQVEQTNPPAAPGLSASSIGAGLILVALMWLAFLWLRGGLIGYLGRCLRGNRPALSVMWKEANRAFWRLLGASGVTLGMVGLVIILLVGCQALLRAVPLPATAFWDRVGVCLVMLGMVWLVVRLLFWDVGIVLEGLGPLRGLWKSVHVTRGRWWKTWGLSVVLGLISVGLLMAVTIVGVVVVWLRIMPSSVNGLFFGACYTLQVAYALSLYTAALICFYTDATPSSNPSC